MRRLVLVLTLLILAAVPLSAQNGVTWKAEFYENPYLLGDALTINTGGVDYDWGLSSPFADKNPVDHFSARFTTNANFASAGVYRFSILADDEVRVSIDFRAVIDTFDKPQPGTLLSADVNLTAGNHHIQIDYRERTFVAYVKFKWEPASSAQPALFNVISAPGINPNRWMVAYYANTSLSGSPVHINDTESPSRNFSVDEPIGGMSKDNFSVRWESIQPLEGGAYQINVRADDGVRVYVNGGIVIDQWHGASADTYSVTLNLPKGDHRFTVEYYDALGVGFLEYNFVRLGGTSVNLAGATSIQPTAAAPVPPPTGYIIIAADALNIRSGPGTTFARVGRMPYQAQANVLGRNANDTWWHVEYNGVVGWVASYVGRIEEGANRNEIPITG